MILRDLVDDARLGVRVLHGHDELDRPVGAVFTTDLLDPRRYISGSPLVLSGLMWRHDPADSDTFVRALVEAGAVALAAGEAAFGTVPGDVVEACERYQLPLLAVPVDVSFARIADAVAADQETGRERALAAALGRHRQLLSAIAEGRSIGELLAVVQRELGIDCRVITPSGRPIASAGQPLEAPDLDLVTRTALAADRLPATLPLGDGSPTTVVPADGGLGPRLASWFLVCSGDHRQWSDDVAVTVRELATIVAVELRRWDQQLRASRRIADEVIALVAAGHSAGAEVAVRIADLGAAPAASRMIAVLAAGDTAAVDLAHAVLHDAALHVDPCPITGVWHGHAVALISGEDSASGVGGLRAALDRLAPGAARTHLAAGLSEVVSADAMAGALDEALHAVRLAALSDSPVSVVTSDDITSHVVLLGTVPDEVRQAYATRVLGAVTRYDAEHGGDLLATLDAFLAADCSWSRCAERMHVHVNTVRYRIERVEELIGRDLSRLDDRVDVLLALRSLPHHLR